MLLIGGFTISSALSKTNIDRVLITRVLSLAGTRPSTVLLAFMGVSCFASMWIRYGTYDMQLVSSLTRASNSVQ
jgi:phosphate transporter